MAIDKCIKCGSYAFNLYKEDIDQGGLCDVHYWQYRAHRAEALAKQPAQQESVAVRLWDSQWVNVVNHDNCYRDWSKEDAINHAVKMTEKYIAGNVANNKLPPAQRKESK